MIKPAILLACASFAAPAAAQQPPSDAAMGAKQFGQCRVCHNIDRTKADSLGPNLAGVYNSRVATRRPRFAYSPALKASGLVWNDATLDRWIADPGAMVKGTKMEFIGIPRKPVRANIIAYLKTVK